MMSLMHKLGNSGIILSVHLAHANWNMYLYVFAMVSFFFQKKKRIKTACHFDIFTVFVRN